MASATLFTSKATFNKAYRPTVRSLRNALNQGGLCRYMSSVVTLGDENGVKKFLSVNHKAILYFTATWCPPCKVIKPVFEEFAKKHPEIAFGKVDVDDNSDAAIEFEISAVPTFVFFDGEDAVERFSGADQVKLENKIQDLQKR